MIDWLASSFPEPVLARSLLRCAELQQAKLPTFAGGMVPEDYWSVALDAIEHGAGGVDGLFQLIVAAFSRFPGNEGIRQTLAASLVERRPSPDRIAWACGVIGSSREHTAAIANLDALVRDGGAELEDRLREWNPPIAVLSQAPTSTRLLALLWLDPSRFPTVLHGASEAEAMYYDIILSHAATEDDDGWVSRLERVIVERMTKQLGHVPAVLRIEREPPTLREAVWHRAIATAKVFAAVVSPAYAHSEPCEVELRRFAALSEGSILKIVRVPTEGLREELARLPSYPVPASFEGSSDDASRFVTAAMTVAEELVARLRGHIERWQDDQVTPTVFLAGASDDTATFNSIVRNELVGRGLRVVSPQWRGEPISEFEDEVRTMLRACDLAIHTIGSLPTARPPDAQRTLAELELSYTEDEWADRMMRRVIWVPPEVVVPTDRHQARFIAALREDPMHHEGADVIFGPISELFGVVRHRIVAAVAEREAPHESAGHEDPSVPWVYLVSHPRDAAAAREVEEYLYALDLDVLASDPTDESITPEELRRGHETYLRLCNAYLIHYGKAPQYWVREQLHEALRANAMEREHRLDQRDIYLAPPIPVDRPKFRTKAKDVKLHCTPSSPPPDAVGGGPASILSRWQLEPLEDFAAGLKARHRRRNKS